MRVIASVQVRVGSERLPGKIMRCSAGKPMIWHLLNRLRQCTELDEVAVATADSRENDIVELFCKKEAVPYYRGSEEDVLGRMLGSLRARQAEVGVVVYGDNPLIDPSIIDEHVAFFKSEATYDWVGNDLKTTFPPGMEVEVFTVQALADSADRVADPSIREHGTLFIRQNPTIYRLHNIEAQGARRRPEIYLGVDTPADAEVLDAIIEHFREASSFSLEQILSFLDQNPELARHNRNIPRRWRKYRIG